MTFSFFFFRKVFAFVQLFVVFVAVGSRHRKYFASRSRELRACQLVGSSLKVCVNVNFVCACKECENF